jgi:hypothetical protein
VPAAGRLDDNSWYFALFHKTWPPKASLCEQREILIFYTLFDTACFGSSGLQIRGLVN